MRKTYNQHYGRRYFFVLNLLSRESLLLPRDSERWEGSEAMRTNPLGPRTRTEIWGCIYLQDWRDTE